VTELRIDGSDSKEFAPPASAKDTAHRLRWCGKDEVLTAKSFLLREPMIYYSASAPSDDEPSCIDLSLDVRQPGRIGEDGPSVYPTYAQLSPPQRAFYLEWLSKGRTSSIEHVGYAFLFLCGLERRLLLERADLNEIIKEVVRLRATYASNRLLELHLNRFLSFSLARFGSRNVDEHTFLNAFDKPPANCKEDDLAVALAWFRERNLVLPASWAMAIARQDPRVANRADLTGQTDQLSSLFKQRYREQFGDGLKLTSSAVDREIRYRPVNASLEYRDESAEALVWSVRISNVLGCSNQFAPLADLLIPSAGDLPPVVKTTRTEPKPVARDSSPPPKSAPAQNARERAIPLAADPPSRNSGSLVADDRGRDNSRSGQAPAAQQQPLRWHGHGERVSVKSYLLRDPMVYVSVGSAAEDEASCIDLTLEVGKPLWEAVGALGYYPTYARLNPGQRANYLSWLANGRAGALNDIGYPFLFFYGLERRLLIEQQDLSPIVKECVRLLETYTFSGSFDGYLSRFLAFALARAGIETLKDKWFDAIFEKSRVRRDENFFAVALAWLFRKNAPLPVSWAVRITRQDPRSPGSIAIDRLPAEFHSLFESRYREKFGDGLILKATKRDRSLSYRPASPSRLANASRQGPGTQPIAIPNVLGIQSQFAPLVAIWSSCVEELKPLSRMLARGIDVASREAYQALPDKLKATVEHPDQEKWDQLLIEQTGEDGFALVKVSDLAPLHGFAERARLTRTQSEALAQTAQFVGLVIEPDARLTSRPYAWEDVVSLLRHEEGSGLPDGSRYLAASMLLELGVYIAASDGTVQDAEVDQVARFIESQFLLAPPEVRRLEALKRVFMVRPPTLSGLGKRLQSALTHDQREAVGRFLTGVAAANGIIDRKEISALKNAYRALDIGVDQLNALLEESRRASREPVEVERGDDSASRGELIPPRPRAGRPAGIMLDERRLGTILAETQVVIETLGKAMLDPAVPDEPLERSALPPNDPRFDALDARYHAMLARLLGQRVWQRPEFNLLARSCNVMPAGALDAMNDWACELFNDAIVIENDGELEIQSHLVCD
jgi:uncharacterized tellurite resistance protein B-like protein